MINWRWNSLGTLLFKMIKIAENSRLEVNYVIMEEELRNEYLTQGYLTNVRFNLPPPVIALTSWMIFWFKSEYLMQFIL